MAKIKTPANPAKLPKRKANVVKRSDKLASATKRVKGKKY